MNNPLAFRRGFLVAGLFSLLLCLLFLLPGNNKYNADNRPPKPGDPEPRTGDEIVAAGQFFHTGTRVVLWMDPGGYDAYRVQRRFVPFAESDFEDSQPHLDSPQTPNRYDIRTNHLSADEIERVRGGGWDLPTLKSNVDQFVLHFDVAGT